MPADIKKMSMSQPAPVINYDTVGLLGLLPAEVLQLIFGHLSPIQQFKINVDAVLCAIFNQSRDYNIPASIVNQEELILYLLYSLSAKRNIIDINIVSYLYKRNIKNLLLKSSILSNMSDLITILFDYNGFCDTPLDREKELDINDLDVLYSYICNIIYPILEKEGNSAEYFACHSICYSLMDYMGTGNEYLFTKHFVNKDKSDFLYHLIIDNLSLLIQRDVFTNYISSLWPSKLRNEISAYRQYVVKAWDVLEVYSDIDTIISIMTRVFSDPRLKPYRSGWINEIMNKEREFNIKLFEAIRDSPLLRSYIKWLYVDVYIESEATIMYTNK